MKKKKSDEKIGCFRRRLLGVSLIILAVSLLSGCGNLIDGGIEFGKDVKEHLSYDLPSSSEILQETQERWKDIDFVEMEELLTTSLAYRMRKPMKITISVDSAVSKTSSTVYRKQEIGFWGVEAYESYQVHSNGRLFTAKESGGHWTLAESEREVQWPGTGYEDLSEEEMDEFEVSKVCTVERKSCYELRGNFDIDQVFSASELEEYAIRETGKVLIILYIDRETYLPVKCVYKFDHLEDSTECGKMDCLVTKSYKGWNSADEIDLPEEVREIFEEAINE